MDVNSPLSDWLSSRGTAFDFLLPILFAQIHYAINVGDDLKQMSGYGGSRSQRAVTYVQKQLSAPNSFLVLSVSSYYTLTLKYRFSLLQIRATYSYGKKQTSLSSYFQLIVIHTVSKRMEAFFFFKDTCIAMKITRFSQAQSIF